MKDGDSRISFEQEPKPATADAESRNSLEPPTFTHPPSADADSSSHVEPAPFTHPPSADADNSGYAMAEPETFDEVDTLDVCMFVPEWARAELVHCTHRMLVVRYLATSTASTASIASTASTASTASIASIASTASTASTASVPATNPLCLNLIRTRDRVLYLTATLESERSNRGLSAHEYRVCRRCADMAHECAGDLWRAVCMMHAARNGLDIPEAAFRTSRRLDDLHTVLLMCGGVVPEAVPGEEERRPEPESSQPISA